MSGFSAAAVRLGARRGVPILLGLAPFGMVAGVLAQGQGLSLAEAGLMSAVVFAGSAQLLALGHWGVPAPVLALSLGAFVINLRMALMGPVLMPWLERVRGWRLWGSLFVMADQNWALSVEHMRRGEGDAGFLFGSGLVVWAGWVATTIAGYVLGVLVRPSPDHPLFFAALAVFVALLVPMWRGRSDVVPWAVAAVVATAAARWLPGSWYILIGAFSGALAGAIQDRRAA